VSPRRALGRVAALNHDEVRTEHLLLGLVKEGSGVAARVLKDLGIDLHAVRREVEGIVRCGPDDVVWIGKLPLTPYAKRVVWSAIEEARQLGHNYVGTEHLLLGLLREREGVAGQVLRKLGLELPPVRQEAPPLLNGAGEPAGCFPRTHAGGFVGSLCVFAGGLLATIAGAFLGAGCCPAGVEAGAWLAGALYVAAVALTHRSSPR
jgi:hypothetical protein